MRGSRLRLVLVFLALTAVTLTALDYRQGQGSPVSALRRGVDTVLGPVVRLIGGGAGSAGQALGDLPRLGSYQRENRRLQRVNDDLRQRLRATDGLRCQQQQWNALLQQKDAGGYTVLPAHVVAQGSTFGFEYTATIDAGARDGLRPDMTVVSGLGLVGRTKRVGPFTSTVVLLADPMFAVGSRLATASSFGLATGNGLQPMSYRIVGSKPVVKAGDVLVTTGSGTFQPGVPIGTVTGVAPDANALTRTATVVPFVDVTALDLVGVITDRARSVPRLPLRPVQPGTERSPCGATTPATAAPKVTRAPTPPAGGASSTAPSPGRTP